MFFAFAPRLHATEKVALTVAAAHSTAVTKHTHVIVTSDVDSFVKIGNAVAADLTTSLFLPAKFPMAFSLANGDYVSAILATGTGNLYVSTIDA